MNFVTAATILFMALELQVLCMMDRTYLQLPQLSAKGLWEFL
jgi:hypothetical protein